MWFIKYRKTKNKEDLGPILEAYTIVTGEEAMSVGLLVWSSCFLCEFFSLPFVSAGLPVR